jgi:hypothetical protein
MRADPITPPQAGDDAAPPAFGSAVHRAQVEANHPGMRALALRYAVPCAYFPRGFDAVLLVPAKRWGEIAATTGHVISPDRPLVIRGVPDDR